MRSRWWQLLLFANGTSALVYGMFTEWTDDMAFRLEHSKALFGLAAWLAAVGGFTVVGWSIYNAIVYARREPPRSLAIARVGLATAIAATIALIATIVLLYFAYTTSLPPDRWQVEAIGPPLERHPTLAPWVVIEGCACLIFGGFGLWRAERP